MKILTQISAGQCVEAPEPRPTVRTGLHHEPVPDFFMNIAIANEGLFIRTVKDTVHIPLKELLDLAAAHHPGLVPKKSNRRR